MSREAEEWRDVPGFPGYRVSDHGNFMYPTGAVNSADASRRGAYRRISMRAPDGRIVKSRVHREVLRAFDREPLPGEYGCHFPDKDPQNCALWNLRWSDALGNGRDRAIHFDQDGDAWDALLAEIHAERMSARRSA